MTSSTDEAAHIANLKREFLAASREAAKLAGTSLNSSYARRVTRRLKAAEDALLAAGICGTIDDPHTSERGDGDR